jgi:hypothetical protein
MIVAISVACGAGLAHGVGPIQQEERPADDQGGRQDSDDESDLLAARCCADEKSRLEILGGRAGVRRGDADDRSHAESHGLIDVAGPPESDEDDARRHDRRNRHS